jgi:hypothetical protein
VTLAISFTVKVFSEIFHNTESTKAEILEDDPNFKRSMTIHQCIEMIFTVYRNLHYEKKTSTIQANAAKNFIKPNQTNLILNVYYISIYLYTYNLQ